MTLFSLVYVSLSTRKMTDDELRQLLTECRNNNQKLNITGMLLYRDYFFIQALEGEQEVVEELYDQIAFDKRHRNVTLVYKNTIRERSYSSWSMGFNKLSDVDVMELPGYTDYLQNPNDAHVLIENSGRATQLLESFQNKIYF